MEEEIITPQPPARPHQHGINQYLIGFMSEAEALAKSASYYQAPPDHSYTVTAYRWGIIKHALRDEWAVVISNGAVDELTEEDWQTIKTQEELNADNWFPILTDI